MLRGVDLTLVASRNLANAALELVRSQPRLRWFRRAVATSSLSRDACSTFASPRRPLVPRGRLLAQLDRRPRTP